MEQNDQIAFELQLNTLRTELKAAQQKLYTTICLATVAIFVFVFLFLPRAILSNLNTPTTSQNSTKQPEDASFRSVTTHSIIIVDENGHEVATFNGSGLSLDGIYSQISFSNNGKLVAAFNARSLSIYGSNGSYTDIFPGHVNMDTGTSYTISLGPLLTSTPFSAGLMVYNNHYDKEQANGGPVDQTTAIFSPQSIELEDSSGMVRSSIGQTSLTTETTGSTEVTSLSSIVLFDKKGHVIWETPQ